MSKYIVTGGNRGIGACIVEDIQTKDPDAQIIIISRQKPDDALTSKSDGISWVQADLSTQEGINATKNTFSGADVLINNAGIMIGKNPFDISDEERKLMVAINQNAVVELSLAFIAEHNKNKTKTITRRIINNASIAAQIGHPDMWYGMTKAAIVNLTKSIAKYHGADGIICNCVAPSTVSTDMMNMIPDERKKMMKAVAVTGRFAEPQEIAQTIVWLATQSPEYMNGACIDINNTIYLR